MMNTVEMTVLASIEDVFHEELEPNLSTPIGELFEFSAIKIISLELCLSQNFGQAIKFNSIHLSKCIKQLSVDIVGALSLRFAY